MPCRRYIDGVERAECQGIQLSAYFCGATVSLIERLFRIFLYIFCIKNLQFRLMRLNFVSLNVGTLIFNQHLKIIFAHTRKSGRPQKKQ